MRRAHSTRNWQRSIPLLCAFIPAVIALAGCMKTYVPPPQLDPPVPSSVQAQAQQTVQGFVADLNRKDYPAAEALLSPTLRAQMPPRALAGDTGHAYKPFLGSADWGVDQSQYLRHGKQVVERDHFTGVDHIVYRTNFELAQSPAGWQISMILPPSKPPTQHLIVTKHSPFVH